MDIQSTESRLARASTPTSARPGTGRTARAVAPGRPKSRKVRAFWIKQLHSWHWISAAISLAGMFLFAITGITLNHAASIGATPKVVQSTGQLPRDLVQQLGGERAADAPLPAPVASRVESIVAIDLSGRPGEWSDGEVYVAAPGPGRDAWVSIDRTSGAITAESTWRGWVSYLNDLHKGRNTGTAWFWFIDAFAIACIVFTLTGLVLLQLHSRHRPLTWPLVGASVVIPLALALFLIH
jgi:hypothetical protein